MPMSSPAAAFFSQAVRLLRALVGDSVVIKTIIRRSNAKAIEIYTRAIELSIRFMDKLIGFGASSVEGVGDTQGGFFRRLEKKLAAARTPHECLNHGIG